MQWVVILAAWSMWIAWGSGIASGQPGAEARIRAANTRTVELFNAGKREEALRLAEETLREAEQLLGAEHPDTAAALNNLAALYRARGEYEKAEPLYQRALAILEKVLGAEHPDTATLLNNLAFFYNSRGEYEKAEPLYQRALAISQKALGAEHFSTALALKNLAGLHWEAEQRQEASDFMSQAEATQDRLARVNIASQAETAMQTIARSFLWSTDFSLNAHLSVQSKVGRERTAHVILSRKALIQEAAGHQYQALLEGASPTVGEKLEALRTRRAELAAWMFKSMPASQQDLQRLVRVRQEAEQLEAALAREYPAFGAATQAPQVEDVRKTLPAGTVMVEFYRYRRYSQGRDAKPQEAHYAGSILGAPEDDRAEDLGPAEAIEAHVATLREALQSSGNTQVVRQGGAQLYHLLLEKFTQQLSGARRLLISPDGALNLIPFEVLVDEQGRHIVERWEIGYVATGRDVLRWQERRRSQAPVTAFVAPDYNAKGPEKAPRVQETSLLALAASGTRRASPVGSFAPLAGAAREGQIVLNHFSQAVIVQDGAATKKVLKGLRGPRILHLATHGFVLQDREVQELPIAQGRLGEPGMRPLWDNPMLRAGVALAGANVREAGGAEDDGILMAAEAARLDLRGTQLVVLSACETGLGEVRYGEGVMGLRRAFTLAGARAQLFSLWEVSDPGTVALMEGYYQHLVQGKGHAESLRAVQLALLQQGVDPSVWASFVAYGDPGPIGE